MRWATNCTTRQHKSSSSIIKDFSVSDAFSVLKSHYSDSFTPQKGSTKDICMHATSLLNPSHTVGSMVVEISPNCKPILWLTGTSNPCISLFKPVFFGEDFGIPQFDGDTYFWLEIEKVHRLSMKNYSLLNEFYLEQLAEYQQYLVATINDISIHSEKDISKLKLTEVAFRYHLEKIHAFYKTNKNINSKSFSPLYNIYWRNMKNLPS
jgi:hypothetical protein